jgi:hypothetical protein
MNAPQDSKLVQIDLAGARKASEPQIPPDAPVPQDRGIWAFAGVNRYGEPFVQLRRSTGQVLFGLTTDLARDLARNLLSCAEAAETDLVVTQWLKERMKVDDARAAQILLDFRRIREAITNRKTSPPAPELPPAA